MTFEEARAQFPVLERFAYLNAGTNGPLARSTAEAVIAETRADLERGRGGAAYYEQMLALRDEVRAGFAAVLDVSPSSIALVDSTSRGCATVLAGLRLTADDEVVTTDQEHFGLIGSLRATGAHVVVTEADENAILAAVTPRTRLVATSHVLWTTGRRLDLARIRRESGVPMLADGAQGAGAIPVDVSGLDFYTVSAQKWLCAPDPAGALYVRDPDGLYVAMPSSFAQDVVRARRRVRREGGGSTVRQRLDRPACVARYRRRARDASRVALRARGGDGGTLRRAARAACRGRYATGTLDARLVPPARRSDGARHVALRERRDRARAAGTQPRARVRRLVDERGGPGKTYAGSPSSAAIGLSASTTVRMWSSSSTPSSSAPL